MKNKKVVFVFLLLLLLIYSCTSWKSLLVSTGNKNDAINNAIIDFMYSCKLRKTDSIFSIHTYIENENIICLSILGYSNDKVYPFPDDKIGDYSKKFPTRYISNNGKLFYWNDSTIRISPEIVDVLLKYNHIDSLMIDSAHLYFVPPYTYDGGAKEVVCFFCKNNLKNYKKNISRVAFGSYPPPKLKCISFSRSSKKNYSYKSVGGDYKILGIKYEKLCYVIRAQKGDSIFQIVSEKQYFKEPVGYKIKKGGKYNLKFIILYQNEYGRTYQNYYLNGGGTVRLEDKTHNRVYRATNLDGLYINE